MTVDDNLATLPPSVLAGGSDLGQRLRLVDDHRHHPVDQTRLARFNPNRIFDGGLLGRGQQLRPVTITDANSQNADDTNDEQGCRPAATTSRPRLNPAITVSQGRAPERERPIGRPGDPRRPGRGRLGLRRQQYPDGQHPLRRPRLLLRRAQLGGRSRSGLRTADLPDPGQPLQHHRPEHPRRPGQHRRHQRRVPGPGPDRPQRPRSRCSRTRRSSRARRPVHGAASGTAVGVQIYPPTASPYYESGRSSTTTRPATSSTRPRHQWRASRALLRRLRARGAWTARGTLRRGSSSSLGQRRNGINGTWKLITLDSNTSTTATPERHHRLVAELRPRPDAGQRRLHPRRQRVSVLPITVRTGVPTTTTVPASPVPIGPGVVMAQDNTLGPRQPERGADLRRVRRPLQRHDRRQEPHHQHRHLPDVLRRRRPDLEHPVQVNDDSSDSRRLQPSPTTQNPNDSVHRPDPVPAGDRRGPGDRHRGPVLARCPQRPDEHPGRDLHRHQHRRRPHLQRPDLRQPPVDRHRRHQRPGDRRPGPGARQRDGPADNVRRTPPTATAPRWAWPSTTASSTRCGPATSTRPSRQRRPRAKPCPSLPADGHRGRPADRQQHHGADPVAEAASGSGHLHRHLRPADQPARRAARLVHPRRRPGLLPRHHQRRLLDPAPGPEVTPVASSGVGPGNKFGYTEFTVTFDPAHQPSGGPSGIANYTGTYSYLIAPDDGAGNPIVAPVHSFIVTSGHPAGHRAGRLDVVPLRIPTAGTGGTGTTDDITTSTIIAINGTSPTRSSPGSRST